MCGPSLWLGAFCPLAPSLLTWHLAHVTPEVLYRVAPAASALGLNLWVASPQTWSDKLPCTLNLPEDLREAADLQLLNCLFLTFISNLYDSENIYMSYYFFKFSF